MCSDPLYTLSSETDHARATLEAHTSVQKLVSAYHIVSLKCVVIILASEKTYDAGMLFKLNYTVYLVLNCKN